MYITKSFVCVYILKCYILELSTYAEIDKLIDWRIIVDRKGQPSKKCWRKSKLKEK